MSGCTKKVIGIYRDGVKIDTMGYSCCDGNLSSERIRPHEGTTSHFCGGIENGTKVFEWEDGTFTRGGKEVNKDGSEKVDTVTEFTLPDPPPLHTVVKAGPKSYTRWAAESSVTSQWQEVGNTDNIFTWPQLFVKAINADGDNAKITVVGLDAESHAKATIVGVLRAGGVSMPNSTSRAVVAELKSAGLLVGPGSTGTAKVGDVFRIGVDALPDNVIGLKEVGREEGLELTIDGSNGLWRFGNSFPGWADWATNKDTRDHSYGGSDRFKSHGTSFRVTKVKG